MTTTYSCTHSLINLLRASILYIDILINVAPCTHLKSSSAKDTLVCKDKMMWMIYFPNNVIQFLNLITIYFEAQLVFCRCTVDKNRLFLETSLSHYLAEVPWLNPPVRKLSMKHCGSLRQTEMSPLFQIFLTTDELYFLWCYIFPSHIIFALSIVFGNKWLSLRLLFDLKITFDQKLDSTSSQPHQGRYFRYWKQSIRLINLTRIFDTIPQKQGISCLPVSILRGNLLRHSQSCYLRKYIIINCFKDFRLKDKLLKKFSNDCASGEPHFEEATLKEIRNSPLFYRSYNSLSNSVEFRISFNGVTSEGGLPVALPQVIYIILLIIFFFAII